MAVTFTATLKADGGMFFEVPPEIMSALGGGKRPAVRVIINGVLLRTTIAVYGGRSYIGVRREIRDAASVMLGDEVELSVEVDATPSPEERWQTLTGEIPESQVSNPKQGVLQERGPYLNGALTLGVQPGRVDWVLAAKRRETREQRVAEAPDLLKRGRRTPQQRNL